ncbi:MAG: ATP synthase F1 subunit gamma [Acidimicrobiales bacterium]|jgi:F-type H+-transporting ATPase subunit gamma
MAGGQERILRRRIKSIKSTQKITKAMELIAASQIVRAQGRIAASRPYQEGMARIVLETVLGDPVAAGRLLGTPEHLSNVLVLSIVADRGLCGGYNTSVFRATERLIAAHGADGVETRLVAVGKKAQGYFRFRGQAVEKSFLGMSERPSFANARDVAAAAIAPFVNGEVDQVVVVSTRFISAGTQRVEVRQLLPLVDPRESRQKETHEHVPGESRNVAPHEVEVKHGYTEFEPDAAILLADLAPRAAETEIFAALLEASASELTARQRAMAAATENAGELIKKYSRIMNRARQDTITTEIMEIVSGAEALRAGADDDEGGIVIETRV